MGTIQIPVDGAGKYVDTVTLTDALVEVHRQKIVLTGGSGTAEVVVVTDSTPAAGDMGLVVRQAGALNISAMPAVTFAGTAIVAGVVNISAMPAVTGTVNISGTAIVAGAVNISAMPAITGTVNLSGTALCAVTGTVNISGTAVVSGNINISAMPAVTGTVNISGTALCAVTGTVNISGTAQVAIGTPIVVNNISATVTTGLSYVIEKTSNSQVQVGDSANAAIRVNVVAGAGLSQVDGTPYTAQEASFIPMGGVFDDATPGTLSEGDAGAFRLTTNRALHVNFRDAAGAELGNTSATGIFVRTATVALAANSTINNISAAVVLAAGAANIGFINNISATVTVAGVVGLTAGTANIGSINNISATVTVAGNVNISATPSVILAAGTANFGTLNNISRTVQVAIGTPFTIDNISAAVVLAAGAANIGSINNISRTVVAAVSQMYINTATPSASRGPKTVLASTSVNVSLIVAPGAGMAVYITALNVSNAGATGSRARIGTSASIGQVTMFMASAGGGFIMNFTPPWEVSANEAVLCSVKPNTSEGIFNVHFFVASADAL